MKHGEQPKDISTRLLTKNELAAFLHVSARTVQTWQKTGKLPAPLIGGINNQHPRWLLSDVISHLRNAGEVAHG